MSTLIYVALIIVILLYFWHKWLTRYFTYFEKIGLPYRKTTLLLGDLWTILLKKVPFLDFIDQIYYLYPNERVIGNVDIATPTFFIRDPELIRKITIKDFDHFTDRQDFGGSNELFIKSLSLLKGQKWKDMRATLSPAFTGSKMRQMFMLIDDCSDKIGKYLLKNEKEKQIIEVRDVFARFTNDTIASCAFGIEVNSLIDRDNEFYKLGQSFLKPNFALMFLKMVVMRALPFLTKLLNLKLFDNNIDNFFRSLIIDTMKVREEKNIYRPDMINLLMQVRKGGIKDDDENTTDNFTIKSQSEFTTITTKAKSDWSDDYLIAQCLLFFVAGYSTTSTTLTLLAYELALNPDVQQKLIDEIDECERCSPGKLTYTTIQSMKYLDMVMSEILRKWPPAPMIDRVCIKNYEIYENDKVKYEIPKGRQVQIPSYSLQRDSKYFPNPERFDPERFNEVNVEKIVPGTYIPFGAGPRSCIASRFALMQAKTVIYHLLKNFIFEICEKTVVPLKTDGFFLIPKEGIFLELKKRIKN